MRATHNPWPPAWKFTRSSAPFLVAAAGAEAQASALQALFAGVQLQELMSWPAVTIPGRLSVGAVIAEHVVQALYTSYPAVGDDGEAAGIVRLEALRSVPADQRDRRAVSGLADRDPELEVAPEELITDLLSRPAFARVGRAVVVAPDGTVAGLISVSDLERMRTIRALQPAAMSSRKVGRSPVTRDEVPVRRA